MVYLITGKLNSGKTTKTIELFSQYPKGEGFVSVKTMNGLEVVKFDLVKLSTSEKRVLAYKTPYYQNQYLSTTRLGEYYFQDETFLWAESEIDLAMSTKKEPIFIDEVGLLELNGQGFYSIIQKLIQADYWCYIAIRDTYLPRFVELFQIKAYKIIAS